MHHNPTRTLCTSSTPPPNSASQCSLLLCSFLCSLLCSLLCCRPYARNTDCTLTWGVGGGGGVIILLFFSPHKPSKHTFAVSSLGQNTQIWNLYLYLYLYLWTPDWQSTNHLGQVRQIACWTHFWTCTCVQCVSSPTFHFTAVTNRSVTCICICGCISFCSVNVFSPVFSVFVFPYVCRTKCYLRITRGWMELVSIYSLVSASGSISQQWQARAEFLRAKRRPRGNPSYLSGRLSVCCQHRKQ